MAAIRQRRKNPKTRGKMQMPKMEVEKKMSRKEKEVKKKSKHHCLPKRSLIQNPLRKEKKKRVDLNQEDSEGVPTADAPTRDDQKTDEIVIVEIEEIQVIVREAIVDVMIAPERKAGVTEAGDAIEDRRVEGIRDQLENPKISRKEGNPYLKQPMLTRAGEVVERKRTNR